VKIIHELSGPVAGKTGTAEYCDDVPVRKIVASLIMANTS
jgi:hypothetical protein